MPFSPTDSSLCYLWENPSYFTSMMTAQERGRVERTEEIKLLVAGVTNTDADLGGGNAGGGHEYTLEFCCSCQARHEAIAFPIRQITPFFPLRSTLQAMLFLLQQVRSPKGKSPSLIFFRAPRMQSRTVQSEHGRLLWWFATRNQQKAAMRAFSCLPSVRRLGMITDALTRAALTITT